MKKYLWTIFCVVSFSASASPSRQGLIDSLRRAYDAAQDRGVRLGLLLDLKDLTDSSDDEMYYTRKLLDEAFAAGDAFGVGASLGSMGAHYIGRSEGDSLELLLRKVEPLLRGSSMDGLPTYYRMVHIARRIQIAATEESIRLCREYVDSVGVLPAGDVYEEASRLFLKGIAAYKLASVEGRSYMERGLPYWNDELSLLPRMAPTARRNFHANLLTCLIAAYGQMKDRESLVRAADDYLAMLDDYYRNEEVLRRRPYIAKEMSYMVCYYTMCTSPLIDRRRAQAYYERYRRFVETARAEGNILIDKRGLYNISIAYYRHIGDHDKEMAYNDSLIMISRHDGMSSLLVGMYDRRAKLLERLGRYREACGVYNEMVVLRDSLSSHEYAEKVGELEVRYGLDKVERDRALILAQKRKNSLWFVATILLLAIGVVIYLWRNLRRIERLQRELTIESERARESDRLKRDFMSSMSHEIRTPLNAINGFAELIAEGGFSPEEAAEYAAIIHENTQLFTSMISDMLEVAQLDSTNTELPKHPVDICRIIREEAGRLSAKEGVECRLELAEPEIVVPLHRGYVSILIRELLKNAVKFTDRGDVTVECGLTGEGLRICVSDEGPGIDPELAEKIFERFYKKDSFSQGVGLGLSLCRSIAGKSGGTIRLDTSYDRGARFIVTFPA